MKRFAMAFTCGILTIATAILFSAAGRSEQPATLRDFMRVKLSRSQKVLEGLTTADFDMIAKNAQALSLLSMESNWRVIQTTEYLERSRDFRRACDGMSDAAKKKNLDGAALAYVDMTMKCITCHKYVRGVRTTTAAPDNLWK